MTADSAGRQDTYWAADPDEEYVVAHLEAQHGTWSQWQTNPVVQAWTRNMLAYYSTVFRASSIDTSLLFGGRQGELVEMMVPQARSIITQTTSIVTKTRLSYQTLARTSAKSDAVKDARFGNDLINQILDLERVDGKAKAMTEGALVAGQWFMSALWNNEKGQKHEKNDFGRIMRNGKIDIGTHSVFDVLYNYNIVEWEDVPWVDLRMLKNRWDLIGRFPELRDEILKMPAAKQASGPFMAGGTQDEDMVWAYLFIHRPTEALENGRIIYYGSEDAIFDDNKNEYETLPIEVMRPEPIMGTGFGYPFLSNLLPAQEMLDHSFSAIATNHSGRAIRNVTAPKGAGVTVADIGGMNLFTYTPQMNVQGGGRPEALDLLGNHNENYKFISVLVDQITQLGNLNGAMRGTPPPGVTSGRAIATLVQNALEFINDTGAALQFTLERIMMHALNGTQKFAKTPHDLTTYGRNNQAKVRPYTGKELQNLVAVKITAANPLMQTMSGRIDLAKDLKQEGFIVTGGQYMQVLKGKDPEDVFKRQMSEQDCIDLENEELQNGETPLVLSTDDHAMHIQDHLGLLNDPQVRRNGSIVKGVMDHVLWHEEEAKSVDPYLYAMARTGKSPQMLGEGTEGDPSGGGPAAMPEEQGAEPADDALGRDQSPMEGEPIDG